MTTDDNGVNQTASDENILGDEDIFGDDPLFPDQNKSERIDEPAIKAEQLPEKKSEDTGKSEAQKLSATKEDKLHSNKKSSKKMSLPIKIILWSVVSLFCLYIVGILVGQKSVDPVKKAPKLSSQTQENNNAPSKNGEISNVLAEFDSNRSLLSNSTQPDVKEVQANRTQSPTNTLTEDSVISKDLIDFKNNQAQLKTELETITSRLLSMENKVDALDHLLTKFSTNKNGNSNSIPAEFEGLLEAFIKKQQIENRNIQKSIKSLNKKITAVTATQKSVKSSTVKNGKATQKTLLSTVKLTVAMAVEGRGVFITESGKEITLEKGDQLKGFGEVTHVDLGGCIYGVNNAVYKATDAVCPK